ncbi:uncharacterized protein LOC116846193 isoform X2 [Odontomachus brunneus]|uniref:uncharacterized protein LOC116846193 isoform X2 n=1 Tax=Odontomachus brunneus TaxID=486640 RepID=UPI0013F24343|nr:uncharacterized protein LOC116846193 isoform X2 [Odontomachus brunneus]
MTGTRMTPALGVCIGTLLLLFGDPLQQVTAVPIVPPGKFDSQVTPTPQGATTILTRISPSNKSIGEKDRQNVELTSRTAHDGENGSRDRVDPDESQNEGKSDVPVSHHETHASSQAGSSTEEIESADSSKKYGEISAESSGKSTNAVSERPLKLSRTNELTVTTTKPKDSKQDNKKNSENATHEESPDHEGILAKTVSPSTKEKLIDGILNTSSKENLEFKQDTNVETTSGNHTLPQELLVHSEDKKNLMTEEIMTVASIEDSSSTFPKSTEKTAKSEKNGKANKSDHKEVIPKLESRKDKNSTLANFTDRKDVEDWQLKSHDRELTTMRGVQHEDVSESKEDALDSATTASEAFDLEKTDGKRRAVSLINDTYVNYKPQAEKESRDNARDQVADVDGSRSKGDPKEEVEVVENVTHQPILKIIDTNNTAANHSHTNEVGNGQTEVVYKRGKVTVTGDKDDEEQKVFNASIKSADDDTGERKSIDKPESQVRSLETTTLSAQPEEQTTSRVIPSPIPQGRTIEFSGVNEFPSVEVKSTTTTRIDTIFGTAPAIQSTKMITPKPYLHVESVRSLEMTTETTSPKPRNSSGDVAEETSAYENTISREESGKKSIVTEASVVLENSIQQQKPDEKGLNEGSANITTESSSAAITTVIPIMDEIRPTNETFPDKSNSGVKSMEKKDSRAEQNDDASTAKSGEKAIASTDEDHDVTGKGITEISLPENDGMEVIPRPVKATTPLLARSTETPITRVFSLNTDIQTQSEEAMMNRSTIVVADSTRVPLDKDTATGPNQFTIPSTPPAKGIMSTPAAATVENTKLTLKAHATLQPLANHSDETAPTTLNPDESSVPTTTSIEFEFVGLTEAISSNTTEKSTAERTFKEQTIPMRITTPRLTTPYSSSTKNSSAEEAPTMTAKLEDFTELPTTSEHEIPTTEPISSITANNTDEVLPTVTELPVKEQSTEFMKNEVTTNVIDFTAAMTEIGILGVTDDPSASKNSSLDANVTLTVAPGATELPPKPIVTVPPDVMKNIMKSHSVPPTSISTLEPEVFGNTPNSSEPPDKDVTADIRSFQDEITLLVNIVIEGSPQEICPRMLELKNALAMMLTSGMNKLVFCKQIVIHKNPCYEPTSSLPTSTDIPLTSILVYVIDEDGKFNAAMTKNMPSLYKVTNTLFPVKIVKFVLVQETGSESAIAAAIFSSMIFICLVAIASLMFIVKRRRTRFNYGQRCQPVSLDTFSLDNISAYNSIQRRKVTTRASRSYGNPTFEDSSTIPSHPLNFTGLLYFYNDLNLINEEFLSIPQFWAEIDELPPGAELKNRYANVIPFPETRVSLKRLNNDAMTEYINASYVRGPKNAVKYYIACQAPLDTTVIDFWRMIWEQHCKVIIMLTHLVENGVEKCTEYIPPSEVTDCHRLYGDFQVTLKKRETKEKYAISMLHLKNLENNTFREVYHIWYFWSLSDVESDGASLIAVLLEARALHRGGPGPIVVHCSSGTGRTGTLIALDLGIRQYEITRTVDMPRVVYTIRKDRAGAVQTKEQYALIYKALNLYATKLSGGTLE